MRAEDVYEGVKVHGGSGEGEGESRRVEKRYYVGGRVEEKPVLVPVRICERCGGELDGATWAASGVYLSMKSSAKDGVSIYSRMGDSDGLRVRRASSRLGRAS